MVELAKGLLHLIIEALTWFIVLGALLTFIPPHQRNGLINGIIELLDKLLSPVRRFLPPVSGIDLSPLIAIIFLQLVDSFLRGL